MRLRIVVHVVRHQILLALRSRGQIRNFAVLGIDDHAFAGRNSVHRLQMIFHVVSGISSWAANFPNTLKIGPSVSAARHGTGFHGGLLAGRLLRPGRLRKCRERQEQSEENRFHLLGSS